MLIEGATFTDHRGTLCFVNDFHFTGIKRFYTITHPDTTVTRAWQGHKIESKHFFVTKGKFLICWVEIDDWLNPDKKNKVHKQILSSNCPQILMVPCGHANGFKALEPGSTLIVFSDLTLEEAKGDNFRYVPDYWL